MSELQQRCIACNQERRHDLQDLVLEADDVAYSAHKIARCSVCGLLSSYPMPGREELRAWYVGGRGVPDPIPATGIRRLWHRTHDEYMVNLITRHAPSGTLVDVGAGSGRFVRHAASKGRWKIIATEYSDDSVRQLQNEGFDARLGNLDEVGLDDGSVDAVWASHVIEHLPDVEGFLASVRRVLKPGGILVALVPSQESMRARLNLTTWHHVNPPGHLWGFRPETFRMIMANNGFDVRFMREVHIVCELVSVARKVPDR